MCRSEHHPAIIGTGRTDGLPNSEPKSPTACARRAISLARAFFTKREFRNQPQIAAIVHFGTVNASAGTL